MPIKLTVTKPADFVPFERSEINQGIHQRFEKQVKLRPEKSAIEWQGGRYGYAELNCRANALAVHLLRLLAPGSGRVGLLLPNNAETIVSMLGCMKSGKAYVPLDVNFPADRLAQMVADCEPELILCDSRSEQLAAQVCPRGCKVLNLAAIDWRPVAENPGVRMDPMDLAYILYTSGSTGKPKGIAFVHRNLLHTKMCLTNELFYSASDRVTWLHSPSFGSSVVDIYCALANGGTMLPWDSKAQGFTGMGRWLNEMRATTFHWIPSALRQFARTLPEGTLFDSVRISVMAGEPLTRREVDLHRKFFSPRSHLVNQVGTGESYNYYLYRLAHDTPLDGTNVPGGHPVSPDRELLILDDDLRPMPAGQVGEIGIRSRYMSIGYWRDPELTRAKFVTVGGDSTPVYLTGDLGVVDSEGCLTHLGRKDFQIKVRGVRIEPADIEHVLNAAPGIKEAAVWVAKNPQGEDQLVAYVVVASGGVADERAIAAHLAAKLPDYMVPRRLVRLESLPMLPTGKVNRRALPNPFAAASPPAETTSRSPEREDIARRLESLYREVLGVEAPGHDRTYGELGGDSLSAAVLASRIHDTFGVSVPFTKIASGGTLASVAAYLKSAGAGDAEKAARHRESVAEAENLARQAEALASATVGAAISKGRRGALVIIGAGQFGREALTWANHAAAAGMPIRIKGFLDTRPRILDGKGCDVPILGSAEDYEIQADDVFVGAIGDPKEKLRYYGPIIRKGGAFISLVHPTAVIGRNVTLGAGVIIGPFCSVTCDAAVGNHVSIGSHSNVAHDCKVGPWSQISSHCGINGMAQAGSGVFMGSHAALLPGVKAGSWSFVAAGALAVSDIAPGSKVHGNPAQPSS